MLVVLIAAFEYGRCTIYKLLSDAIVMSLCDTVGFINYLITRILFFVLIFFILPNEFSIQKIQFG